MLPLVSLQRSSEEDTMRRFIPLLLFIMLALPSSAWARVVAIEASAPVADRSEAAMDLALRGAVEVCVRHATSLGLSWIRFERAALVGNRLLVLMVASDDEDGDADEIETSPAPEGPTTRLSV